MSIPDDELEDDSEGASTDPHAPKMLRVRATFGELNYLKSVTKDMSNFVREAIREKLEREVGDIPEGFFFERPPGNWTKGELRRGKEKPPVMTELAGAV